MNNINQYTIYSHYKLEIYKYCDTKLSWLKMMY